MNKKKKVGRYTNTPNARNMERKQEDLQPAVTLFTPNGEVANQKKIESQLMLGFVMKMMEALHEYNIAATMVAFLPNEQGVPTAQALQTTRAIKNQSRMLFSMRTFIERVEKQRRSQMKTARVQYQDRDREIPSFLSLTQDHVTTHWGVPLTSFWSPNSYATPVGAWSWYLTREAYMALNAANEELRVSGCCVILVDAYRTYEQQQKAFEDPSKAGLVVSPDDSWHTKGLAIDARLYNSQIGVFNEADEATYGDQQVLAAVLARHGWKQPLPQKEPWHFEYR